MKRILVSCLLLLAVLGLTSCSLMNPARVTVFSNDGNVSISVPSGWSTNDATIRKIFPAAVIAASDTANQEYVAVIGEPKARLGSKSTAGDFLAQIKISAAAIVANGVWENASSVKIDGLNGLSSTLSGTWRVNRTDSTFFVTALANDNFYYAIVALTSTSGLGANEATLRQIIDSFKAPATTVLRGSWKPYAFPQSAILFLILLAIGIALVVLGSRLKRSIQVAHPGKALRIGLITIWALSILFIVGAVIFYRIGRTAIGAGQTGIGPIFPITLACAVGAFIYIAYISRRDGIWTALGNGFVAAAAGPMVFEFIFDMIVIPQIKGSAVFLAAYFGPLDFAVLLTVSLLFLPRRVSITKPSIYAFGALFIVFAVWAWFGFSYPSNPLSFALNAISKVLSFVCVAALFSTGPEQGASRAVDGAGRGQ